MERELVQEAENVNTQIGKDLFVELGTIENKQVFVDLFMGHICGIQPRVVETKPSADDRYIGFITSESEMGLGGARTIKYGNIVVYIGKLYELVLGGGVTTVGFSSHPVLMFLSALIALKGIFDLKTISLSERHAIVTCALWEYYGQGVVLRPNNILSALNERFQSLNRGGITLNELTSILSALEKLHCIQYDPTGSIILSEEIHKKY